MLFLINIKSFIVFTKVQVSPTAVSIKRKSFQDRIESFYFNQVLNVFQPTFCYHVFSDYNIFTIPIYYHELNDTLKTFTRISVALPT